MSGERGSQTPILGWLSGGVLVGLMAFLRLAPGDSAPSFDPPAEETTPTGAAVATFTPVEGTISLPGTMWDDPFEHNTDEQLQALPSSSDIKAVLEERIGDDGHIMYVVAPVMAGFNPDNLEKRWRKRHAVELAAAIQGFRLAFPDRMTYRRARIKYHFSPRNDEIPAAVGATEESGQSNQSSNPSESDSSENGAVNGNSEDDSSDKKKVSAVPGTAVERDIFLPTKLYKCKDSNVFILITWIQESHLGKQPLSTIRDIIQPIMVPECGERAAFCLLGPTYSDTLRNIIADGGQLDKSETEVSGFYSNWGLGAVVCNTSCTATDQGLGLSPGQTHIPVGSCKNLNLFHTIGSDDLLLNTLRHELTLRGVWPSDLSVGKIVIFAEQSSLSYVEEMQKSLFETSQLQAIVIPYLKGIALAGTTQVGDGRNSTGSAGSSVQDYLDRSMSELGTLSSSRPINPNRVRAVGIVGSNWEDKNLILAKARGVFPVATFFTTELDARYCLPKYSSHTRNLIVASHYGLGIRGREDIFGRVNNIPSFRDGYQTSAFVGMSVLCYAFQKNKLADTSYELTFGELPQDLFDLVGRRQIRASEAAYPAYLHPLAFEIGSSHPIQLSTMPSPDYLPFHQPAGVTSVHAHGSLLLTLIVLAIGSLLVFNFLAAYSSDASKFRDALSHGFTATFQFLKNFFLGARDEGQDKAGWTIAIPLLIGALTFGVMVVSDNSVESEPILFTDGISLWPTICGLYLVIALSLQDFLRPLRDISCSERATIRSLTWKLAVTIALTFYVVSFLESGFIQPPARDLWVRWLANVLLFGATLSVLLVTCKCFMFSLNARKVIEDFRADVPLTANGKALTAEKQIEIVERCRRTMNLSIGASRKLLGPAALSILFIIARWNWWDSWGQDRSWFALLATPIVISFFAAILVRLTAVRYRGQVVEFLNQSHYGLLLGASGPKAKARADADHIQESIEETTRLASGPFGPLSRDYLLGAAALIVTILFTGPIGALLARIMTFM